MVNLVVAGNVSQFPKHNKIEIALLGRSNAGKSTLINALTKSSIAHTAKSPGKTQTINFYETQKYFLVDMPGYGYSGKSSNTTETISHLINLYLQQAQEKIYVFHVCSIMGLTQQDFEIKNFFDNDSSEYILVLNKIDKVGSQKQKLLLKKVVETTNLPLERIILISGKKHQNINLLIRTINQWVSQR